MEYFTAIKDILASRNTHPMLDEDASDLIAAALREGKLTIDKRTIKKGRQIGLVADLFNRLPVLDIPMDELLSVRTELQRPLTHFRSSMIELSNDIESAVWDKDFPSDIHQIYRQKIEPALVEIEDEIESLRIRNFWGRRIVDKASSLSVGGGASYVLGAAVAPWMGIITAFATAALFTDSGFAEWQERHQSLERNGLYFYYRLREQGTSS